MSLTPLGPYTFKLIYILDQRLAAKDRILSVYGRSKWEAVIISIAWIPQETLLRTS